MEYIGICIECKSDQPGAYMERSPFQNPPCKYCGGWVEVVRADLTAQQRQNFLDQRDRVRGIGSGHSPVDGD